MHDTVPPPVPLPPLPPLPPELVPAVSLEAPSSLQAKPTQRAQTEADRMATSLDTNGLPGWREACDWPRGLKSNSRASQFANENEQQLGGCLVQQTGTVGWRLHPRSA